MKTEEKATRDAFVGQGKFKPGLEGFLQVKKAFQAKENKQRWKDLNVDRASVKQKVLLQARAQDCGKKSCGQVNTGSFWKQGPLKTLPNGLDHTDLASHPTSTTYGAERPSSKEPPI